jgi:hypothetical protein
MQTIGFQDFPHALCMEYFLELPKEGLYCHFGARIHKFAGSRDECSQAYS